ncbi:MAG: GxxExxY protein [Geopsychrobacter sp.]|nr:GxxExxY protein [Geopsychrobacter sp.]
MMDQLTGSVISAAIAVHRELGPGLLESAYEACLTFELQDRGLKIERQKLLPVFYRSQRIDCGYRLDLLVEKSLIVELKSVAKLLPIHKAQLLSYLKMANLQVGLLLNFNVLQMKAGLQRVVNSYVAGSPSSFSAHSALSAVEK